MNEIRCFICWFIIVCTIKEQLKTRMLFLRLVNTTLCNYLRVTRARQGELYGKSYQKRAIRCSANSGNTCKVHDLSTLVGEHSFLNEKHLSTIQSDTNPSFLITVFTIIRCSLSQPEHLIFIDLPNSKHFEQALMLCTFISI